MPAFFRNSLILIAMTSLMAACTGPQAARRPYAGTTPKAWPELVPVDPILDQARKDQGREYPAAPLDQRAAALRGRAAALDAAGRAPQ